MKKIWTFYSPVENAPSTVSAEVLPAGFKPGATLNGFRVLGRVRKGKNNSRYRLDCNGREGFAVIPNEWLLSENIFILDKPVVIAPLEGSPLSEITSLDQLCVWYVAVMTAGAPTEKVYAVLVQVLNALGMTNSEFDRYRALHEDFVLGVRNVSL